MSYNKGLVNLDASHYAGSAFTSTVNPSTVNPNVLPSISSNVQAAAASKIVGGRKINRRKINKISRKYKMKGSRRHVSRRVRRMKSRVRSRMQMRRRSAKRSRSRSHRRSASRGQKGGYAQYQNNMPLTQTYSTGGHLSPSLSALASPVPYKVLSNNTSCVDNYNHFTGAGFPSRGSY
jgi:hypothetical protein